MFMFCSPHLPSLVQIRHPNFLSPSLTLASSLGFHARSSAICLVRNWLQTVSSSSFSFDGLLVLCVTVKEGRQEEDISCGVHAIFHCLSRGLKRGCLYFPLKLILMVVINKQMRRFRLLVFVSCCSFSLFEEWFCICNFEEFCAETERLRYPSLTSLSNSKSHPALSCDVSSRDREIETDRIPGRKYGGRKMRQKEEVRRTERISRIFTETETHIPSSLQTEFLWLEIIYVFKEKILPFYPRVLSVCLVYFLFNIVCLFLSLSLSFPCLEEVLLILLHLLPLFFLQGKQHLIRTLWLNSTAEKSERGWMATDSMQDKDYEKRGGRRNGSNGSEKKTDD